MVNDLQSKLYENPMNGSLPLLIDFETNIAMDMERITMRISLLLMALVCRKLAKKNVRVK